MRRGVSSEIYSAVILLVLVVGVSGQLLLSYGTWIRASHTSVRAWSRSVEKQVGSRISVLDVSRGETTQVWLYNYGWEKTRIEKVLCSGSEASFKLYYANGTEASCLAPGEIFVLEVHGFCGKLVVELEGGLEIEA